MCAIDFSLHSESADLWRCLQALVGYIQRLLIEISHSLVIHQQDLLSMKHQKNFTSNLEMTKNLTFQQQMDTI